MLKTVSGMKRLRLHTSDHYKISQGTSPDPQILCAHRSYIFTLLFAALDIYHTLENFGQVKFQQISSHEADGKENFSKSDGRPSVVSLYSLGHNCLMSLGTGSYGT